MKILSFRSSRCSLQELDADGARSLLFSNNLQLKLNLLVLRVFHFLSGGTFCEKQFENFAGTS